MKREKSNLWAKIYRLKTQIELNSKEKQLLEDSLSFFDQEQSHMDPTRFDNLRVSRINQLDELIEEWKSKYFEFNESYEKVMGEKDKIIERLETDIDHLEKKVILTINVILISSL